MDPMFPGDPSASAALDPLFSGISLHHLLTLDNFPFPPPQQPTTTTTTTTFNLHAADNTMNLLTPKSEFPIEQQQQHQLFDSHLYSHHSQQPFNNIFPQFPTPHFHHLPQLHSPENNPLRKRFRHQETETVSHALPPPAPAPAPPPPVIPQSHLARQRRQKLSEKTRCLQKLMPWDKKMDQGTLLQEAYKYVKFLQAQSSVLQSMPTTTHFAAGAGNSGGVFGEMERLNRSQALQILVNSPVAQTTLYSKGLCVFSAEQVALLRKYTERKQHQHQHQHQHHHVHQNQNQLEQEQEMSDHDSSKTFLN